jgi:hypothetical protein
MRHAYMYHGGFESNFTSLAPGATSFTGSDGAQHSLPPWPSEVDGVRIGYLEKPGKNFTAVRVIHGDTDIILKNDVLIDPMQHMEMGRRFSAEPTTVGNAPMLAMLKAIAAANPDHHDAIEIMRNQIKRSASA